eukprot:1908203-Rhodomonas_salina.5
MGGCGKQLAGNRVWGLLIAWNHKQWTAPSPPTSTPSRWPPARASMTTFAPSRGRMAPPPPSPCRIPTSRPSTARATKCCVRGSVEITEKVAQDHGPFVILRWTET